jgi:hypothetical protein
VTGLLLDKADLPALITPIIVREHLYEAEKFNDNEINVVVRIVNMLRPFTPKRDENNKIHEHILTLGPFCLLANNLLRALGYSDFTRRLVPISSCGKSHAIPLNDIGVVETLCAREPRHFDVECNGRLVSDTSRAKKNGKAILGAFFDLQIVHDICKQHDLQFDDR